jgi:hypothetical protein
MLNGDHHTICRFGRSRIDEDNLEIVQGNITDLYKGALDAGELTRDSNIVSPVAVSRLQARFLKLRQA